MARVISIEELEKVINQVRRTAPPVDGVLSPALRIFAEIYGVMIYDRARLVDIDGLAEDARCEVLRWIGGTPGSSPPLVTLAGPEPGTKGPVSTV